ncbi:hypothetical protein TNCT_467391 [Trichonephila clavata]|uniref:Uncharacterized protein n=1 Tax=Trichonephila clavata TaxID=2740835 RepID=A0A8X6G497_TRICU|nr:hypothetical protein TNCT_467391 [Trichonephila clavata]
MFQVALYVIFTERKTRVLINYRCSRYFEFRISETGELSFSLSVNISDFKTKQNPESVSRDSKMINEMDKRRLGKLIWDSNELMPVEKSQLSIKDDMSLVTAIDANSKWNRFSTIFHSFELKSNGSQ